MHAIASHFEYGLSDLNLRRCECIIRCIKVVRECQEIEITQAEPRHLCNTSMQWEAKDNSGS